jgi:alkanesulfonate monooxygenase SsuD/methylene tetrahydromethanopterin reductase-like flavin-dependent oxidoreductase (luciferase family)
MKIGHFLFPESRFPSEDRRIIHETLEEAQFAERAGVDAVFLSEHHFDGNCAYVDPPTFAAALAIATKRVQIGFAVLQASLYHPLRMAEQLSLIDHLSEGRLIIGLGKGSAVNSYEYEGFEIDPADAAERLDELEDILIRSLTGERLSHRGKFWNFDITMLRPRPFTQPMPQLLRSVDSKASASRQAARGRPILMAARKDEFTLDIILQFKATMSEAGFSPDKIVQTLAQSWVWRHIIIAETDEQARSYVSYFRQMQDYRAKQSEKYNANFFKPGSESEIPPGVLCGSPATILKLLEHVPKWGIGGLIVTFRHGPMPLEIATTGLDLFMKHVAPALK